MIEIKNLTFFYQNPLFEDLNISIQKGLITVLSGESGSGKSTLLKLIAGLLNPFSGTIAIDGRAVYNKNSDVLPHNRNIAMVFQEPLLWPHMTVLENLLFACSYKKDEAKKHAFYLLERAGILHLKDMKPHKISGGEARRAAFLRAVASNKEYILLDEPLVNLDTERRLQFLNWMTGLSLERGLTILYVTHDKEEVKILNGRHLELKNGVIEDRTDKAVDAL